MRHLVPTGTGLKAWLFAAIKLCVPQFPVAPDLQGQVNEAMAAMTPDFQGVQRELLASTVSKLLQAGGALDLKKWVAAVDLTADRAGFLLAHDLACAAEVMRATEEAASVPVKERMKEIVLFSISEAYFALREKLEIRSIPEEVLARRVAAVPDRRSSLGLVACSRARRRQRRPERRPRHPRRRRQPVLVEDARVAAIDAVAPSVAATRPRPDLNVILLSIDSLRADMPWAGYPRPIAPRLTELEERSVTSRARTRCRRTRR